jgi:hypothetical protein
MAVTITLNNSRLMGSSIVADVEVDARTGATFHSVVLTVAVEGAGAAAGDGGTFKFSSPVSGSVLQFDISSAFRAVADRFAPAVDTFSYPYYGFNITSREEWMTDGQVQTADGPTVTYSAYVYIGSYTDLERIKGQTPARWSRKPTTSPEVCFYHPNQQDESDGTSKHLKPGVCSDGGFWTAPAVTQVTVPVADAAGVGSNIYGIPYPLDGHEIRFINSLGVHENIFVAGLPTKEVNITTDKYAIARQETLTQFSRGLAVKHNDYETWTFSSGPLDEAWASWYIHEFLMARWVWISIGGVWIPCHVLPEEVTTLVDRSKAQPYEVQFKLQMDINGSPV